MQAIRFGFLSAVLVSGLPACSYFMGDDGMFRDREGDYIVAPSIEPLAIPGDLDSFTLDELYVIPPAPPAGQSVFIKAPTPNPLDTSVREGVVVQKFGERRWIVVGAEPAQVWPRLKDFWSNAQIPLAAEDAMVATMTSEWIGDEGSRNKYQARIEPGLHSGNSEVYVLQVSETSVVSVDTPVNWPEESIDLQRENDMLDRVSVYLADRTDLYRASSVSLLAGSIQAASKSSVVRSSGGLVLSMRIDMDRAWSQMSQSLDNATINVIKSDREATEFQVSYAGEVDEEDRPGFFARLFGRGDKDDANARVFNMKLSADSDMINVTAVVADGANDAVLQEQLIRTLHTNLI
jgi:outer membrane protein assembly factor BamC